MVVETRHSMEVPWPTNALFCGILAYLLAEEENVEGVAVSQDQWKTTARNEHNMFKIHITD